MLLAREKGSTRSESVAPCSSVSRSCTRNCSSANAGGRGDDEDADEASDNDDDDDNDSGGAAGGSMSRRSSTLNVMSPGKRSVAHS